MNKEKKEARDERERMSKTILILLTVIICVLYLLDGWWQVSLAIFALGVGLGAVEYFDHFNPK